MLKGKTTMTVTKETIITALQVYFNETFTDHHIVVDVDRCSTPYGDVNFIITVEEPFPAKSDKDAGAG